MAKKSSSAKWKRRQAADPWVKKAQDGGWRSRAVFKLEELDQKARLFQGGQVVVDLGAAPGGWSQYAAGKVLPRGRVIALDILPMEPLEGVEFIQADFTEDAALQRLLAALGDARASLVMSDMAPNISGMKSVDQPRSMYLAELALDLAGQVLESRGSFVVKVFMGEGFEEFLKECRTRFKSVKARKPEASRQESRETYILASGYRV
ncbi:MAG: 23S rRNA (uridine(2552)-2'-O)-methyltransferase RlmE [Gammaproteobacteria bacterium]|jgi:23S rRNA (uridine2552-2'-O)-methyltransferase|nr:23S rRNA (uridine(2552)-2'-O)-methyltransferase RlmE [Gammaproteobacteria bacterium]MDP7271898.1 23S rRNA (uridine(2552)-2'-O)-methyltransferase RlmE [Gammaproteobacteria bacterium]HJP04065.1 23S rRNA (uridine(2552)-2'-O)-methyltransferase RlmE [Gammaproteobacteria bacterium]